MSGSESKSPRPAVPLWLILVTLLGGAFLVPRGNQPAEVKDAPPASQVGNLPGAATPEDRVLAPLREFLGLPVLPAKSGEPAILGKLQFENSLPDGSRVKASAEWVDQPPVSEKKSNQADLAKRIKDNVGLLEFLIVSVADPFDTAINYRFDSQLDTLHRALGADGYVPDRYYLPWGSPDKSNAHWTEPGVLLYRRNGPSFIDGKVRPDRTDLLLVYLVGETPTSGIHKEAFLAAVRQIKTLEKMAPYPKAESPSAIHVAGPLFTGAADSLALAIRQAREEKITSDVFRIITGTAVSINASRFEALAGKDVDLHSTVLSGRILKQALINHVLERTWSKPVRIAWLTETGTGYGSSSAKNTNTQPDAEITEFQFPVNISKVRSGYAESRRRERSGQASLGPESSRLPIPFEDTSTARDVPPMQTPKVTAPTTELILRQILTRIRNEGIKFIGISASDPRDPIFLAELIQEQCPDAQIMLVGSDVLFLHSEYRSIMHGTLVCSTYPLHPEALDWCFPFGEEQDGNSRSIVLSSQPNYGLYNAVLFLRGLDRGHYKHGHPTDSDGKNEDTSHNLLTLSYSKESGWPGGLPLGYSMPFEKDATGKGKLLRPPVWISRISSTGICPITVRATDKDHPSDYTFNLKIADPPADAPPLPVWHPRSRIPASLYIASLAWLVVAAIYCAALLIPKPVGNWAKALATVAGHPPEFQSLAYVFRSYITGSFVYVLIMFGTLLYVYHQWVGAPGWGDYVTILQCVLCFGVASILTICLLADWGRAWRDLAGDLLGTLKRLIGVATPASEADLSWHLIAARGVGLTMILVLVVLHVWATLWQRHDWLSQHKEDTFLWFKLTSDMWNGISPAMTAQFLSAGLIILAYGMLLQMHLLSPEFIITRPDPSTSDPPSDEQRKKRQEEVRNALLFPLLSRWRRDRPVVLDILCVAAALLWLGFLGWHLQSPDYCAVPVSFPTTLLLFAGGFWCVRLFKLIQILKGLSRNLEELTKALRKRWPDSWAKIFEQLPEKRVGLRELFWTSRPTVHELDEARRECQEVQTMDRDRMKAKQKLCAIEIELYVRQFFHQIVRLGLGLTVSACLLFLSAQAFPFSQEPLLRLSASIMLAAIGCVMAWYYLKFDRNELLSRLVGTDPKQVSVNWSLIQMIAPALLLTAVALLSQTFPEIWQWLRSVLEPMARSSI